MVPIIELVPMDHGFDESYPFVYIGHVPGLIFACAQAGYLVIFTETGK